MAANKKKSVKKSGKKPAAKPAPKKSATKKMTAPKKSVQPTKKAPTKSQSPRKAKAAAPAPAKATPAKMKKPSSTEIEAQLSPLDNRVVVEAEATSEKTAGGIFIPGTVDERPQQGVVVAKGPGRRNKKGQLRPLDVQVGDRVIFSQYAGTKVDISSSEFLILREEDVLGILT